MKQFIEYVATRTSGSGGDCPEAHVCRDRAGTALRLCLPHNPTRTETERFISTAYWRAFGAQVSHFYPSLLEFRLHDGALVGAAGIRSAHAQKLFLEHYLSRAVQHLIADHVGPVGREEVVEVGNFAVCAPEWVQPFFCLIGQWVDRHEVDWITFALTRTLQRVFRRSGIDLLDLGPALRSRLPEPADDWGDYYEHGPRIMAVRVRDGLARLCRSRGRAGCDAVCDRWPGREHH